jgi:hypothetical protein
MEIIDNLKDKIEIVLLKSLISEIKNENENIV